MDKKYYKKNLKFLILFIFCIVFFNFFASKIFALTLEVKYPTINLGGQSADVGTTLPSYVRYLFFAGIAIGFFAVFLSLLIAGVQYIISPIDPSSRAAAKDRFFGAMSGLLILALTYLILSTINPQLNILNINNLPANPPPPAPKPAPGVYFYNNTNCSSCGPGQACSAHNNQTDCLADTGNKCAWNPVLPNTSDITDLGALKNSVNSVQIVQDNDNQIYYIPIIYDTTNLQGKCQYLDPNTGCQQVDNFANSASVLQYDPSPNGDGVYFYRKPCANQFSGTNSTIAYCNQNSGGYYEVTNSQIMNSGGDNLYVLDLNSDSTRFNNVPDAEQDCIKYDKSGVCTKKQAPTLGGENISSIIINGNYAVLLVYSTSSSGPWASCQIFPTIDDVNKIGPQQIKLERIRNNSVTGVVPNYAIIIPIKQQ